MFDILILGTVVATCAAAPFYFDGQHGSPKPPPAADDYPDAPRIRVDKNVRTAWLRRPTAISWRKWGRVAELVAAAAHAPPGQCPCTRCTVYGADLAHVVRYLGTYGYAMQRGESVPTAGSGALTPLIKYIAEKLRDVSSTQAATEIAAAIITRAIK